MIDFDKLIKLTYPLKLLYVEDNTDTRNTTCMILDELFEHTTVAVDGKDGLDKFKHNNFDLIITDINMPKLNGLEMSEEIRKLNQDIPIIILSAYNEDKLFMKSITIGIDGYLLKPVDINEFFKLMHRIVQKYKYKHEAKSNLHFLQNYVQATNYSSIVSKTDLYGVITYVNDRFCKISAYAREELIGKNHNIVRHPDNPSSLFKTIWKTIKDEKKIWTGIIRNKTKYGKSYYADSLIMPILDLNGNILEYISLRNDITDIMNPLKQLKDALKNAYEPILIYVKLDRFSELEGFYDSDTIDIIQNKAAIILQNTFSHICDFDKLYQLENGEYAFIIEKSHYMNDAFISKLQKSQEIIKETKIEFNNLEFDIAILISMAYEKNKILESVTLGIKKLLKNREDFIIANNLADIMQEEAKKNMEVVSMIKEAIDSSKIVSYFQPIVDNKTQEILKYESLVRLIDKNDKVLSPYFFLETAKKSDYYSKITDIVLHRSFTILEKQTKDISINLSAIDIEQKSTREKIFQLLDAHTESAHRVVFEVLEDEGVKDINVVKKFISDVKSYGVKIAIDDFGAGYSNFERLLDYQPDILKIDGSLIKNIDTSSYSLSAVKSIVTFAKEQNLLTIAEFIENETIFNIVKDLGIDCSQGYYFGKPEAFIDT